MKPSLLDIDAWAASGVKIDTVDSNGGRGE